MALTAGARIGPFLIKSSLGEGGMGVVFRALDTKLQRDVALKLLPDHFADDPERLARFQREAQVLASLNHPNIAQIYGLEESANTRCIVMELVEGETLQERLKSGVIPLDEALPIAKQIAEALEAAHDKGVMHRDLKPANIKVSPNGQVKVLDFGLAKAFETDVAHELSNSPTLVSGSIPGVILGTAAYMAPEQAKGRTVDKRADIFAFGCVFYEMLTGRAAFEGEDITRILACVIEREPDWSRLPEKTPEAIRRLLLRALKKDPRQRLSDIRDARLDIEEALLEPAPAAAPARRTTRKVWPASLAVAAALILLLAIPAALHLREVPRPLPSEIRLELTTPATTHPQSLAISPDGQKIVFVATSEGRPSLWLRALDSGSSRPLAGTDGASLPFWSPDSRSVGFFADAKLKRIDIDGGAPQVLANASYGIGGTWNHNGVVLYSPLPGRPILRVSAKGGPTAAVTRIEPSQGVGHREPLFLPDGEHFLYSDVAGGIYVSRLDRIETKRLIEGAGAPLYVSSRYLLFVRQGTLFAQRFDPGRLEVSGHPFPVVEQVGAWDGNYGVAASETGTIIYRSASGNYQFRFVWFDRSGKETGKVGAGPDTAEIVTMPSISPDGSRLALTRIVKENASLWFLELARGVVSRFTSGSAPDVFPIWSPDGAHLVFTSTRKGGVHNLYRKAANGSGIEELLLETSEEDKISTDWSPDGRYVLYFTFTPKTQNDIWALPLDGGRKPFPVVQTEFEERNGQFSPDGKWIAYQSNESGRFEVYVQPFPGPGPKTPISTDGGAQARWRRDGKELFYMALDSRLMAVPIRLPAVGQTIEAGAPVPLVRTRLPKPVENYDGPQYAVSPDGQRFLVNTVAEEAAVPPISVILNWKPKP